MTEIIITKELVEEFLEEKKDHFSEGYQEESGNILNYLAETLPKKERVTITMINDLLRESKNGSGELVARSTQKTRLGYVKVYLNWLLGRRHEDTLALKDFINKIKEPRKEVKIIDPKTIEKVLGVVPFYYRFFTWVGCKIAGRRTSLTETSPKGVHLGKIEDFKEYFNEEDYQLLVQEGGEEQELVAITRVDKWGGEGAKKEITVPLSVSDTITFKGFMEKRKKEEERLIKKKKIEGFKDERGEYLFWNRYGKRIKPDSATTYFCRLSNKYPFDLEIHDFRRFAIQYWYSLGFREEIIKKLSGHSKKADTIKRYYDPQLKTVWGEFFKKTSKP